MAREKGSSPPALRDIGPQPVQILLTSADPQFGHSGVDPPGKHRPTVSAEIYLFETLELLDNPVNVRHDSVPVRRF